MSEDQASPKRNVWTQALYGVIAFVALLLSSLIIESCDTEKIQVCDTTTGDCALESSCRPLLFDLLR